MLIPHLIVRDREDRSWTFRLLDRLAAKEIGDAEREAVTGSLACLEDPRAAAPLLALLEDRARPEVVREAAASALRATGSAPPGPTLRAWWRQDDGVLRRHALLSMGRAEADLVAPVLADPAHPLHLQAILTAQLGFDEPRFQAPRLAALEHPDPRVRWAAADTLVGDEPCAAEGPLLRCASDGDAGVAVAAVKTLARYPSRRVMAGLSALVSDPRPVVADEAVEVLESLRELALAALVEASSSERAALCAWMEPVWSILEFTSDDLVPPPESELSAVPYERKRRLPAEELIALLRNPDGLWAERKALVRATDPAAFSAGERAILTPFLAGHGDRWVREHAAPWLATWGDHATLQELVRDEAFGVRKSAMAALARVPITPAVAALAWDHLHAPGTTGAHARETLRTYVAHAPSAEAIPRLLALAQTDAREAVRVRAVHELCTLDARSTIARLLPLLEAPPAVTWGFHLALIDAVDRLDLPLPLLEGLRAVDNLHVQIALAPFDPEDR